MDSDNRKNNEIYGPGDVVFVDTTLIQKAAEGLQKSKEEFQAMLEQAELGDSAVYHDLGVRYAEGDGTPKDMERAAHWFAQSAELGDIRSMESLGRCYQLGAGVEADMARALELYQSAADEGHAPAMTDLGLCYENGNGVEEDPEEAGG